MALYQKYKIEFQCFRGIQDWAIKVFQDLTSDPGITNLIATGDPLHIEYLSSSDEFNEPVRASKAVFNAYSVTDFQLNDLFVVEDRKTPIEIYCDGDLYWKGFLQAGEYSEPYKDVPYPVQITALDGIQLLKNILYKYETTLPDDTYYNGRIVISEILCDICAKIGFTGFTEYVNLYETNMIKTINDSALEQSYIDVDIFKDMYCWEVLEELLKPFNAVVRQIGGQIVVYRPIELDQNIVFGRIFTSAYSKTTTSFGPAQSINRIATPSGLLQFPGSVRMQKGPAKKITLTQDYGWKESWIDNWELKGFDNVLDTYPGWISSNVYPIGDTIPGEKDGLSITAISISPPHAYYATQVFGQFALTTTTDVFGFEFDYLFYNYLGSTLTAAITFFIQVTNLAGTYWLREAGGASSELLEWHTSESWIMITKTSLEPGSTGWSTYKRKFTGLPVTGAYTITIYGPASDGSVAFLGAIKNIKFYTSSHSIVMMDLGFKMRHRKKGFHPMVFWNKNSGPYTYDTQLLPVEQFLTILSKEYEVTNAIAGKDLAYEYIIGDVLSTDADVENITEQFAGSIQVTMSLINSGVWATRAPGGEDRPILEVIGGEIGGQYSRNTDFIQMEIQEADVASPALNLMGCFSDSLNLINEVPRRFIFNAGTYNVKRRLWTADLLEIIHVEYYYEPPPDETFDPESFPGDGYGALYNWFAINGIV